MNLKNHKQIRYYSLGLISLLFIPLSYLLAVYKSNPKNERLFCCPLYCGMGCSRMSNDISEYNYLDIYLSDDEVCDKSKIRTGKELIRELTDFKKPIYGIRFHLSDKVKFETIMNLLNSCAIEGKSFALAGNDIWVFHPKQHYTSLQFID